MNIYSAIFESYFYITFPTMKPKDEQKEERIYHATLELVMETGLAGLTMEKVAKKAGIAVGTLYVYFASKEELLEAVYWRIKTAKSAIMFQDFNPHDPFKIAFKKIWLNTLHNTLAYYAEDVFTEQCFRSPYISDELKQRSMTLILPLHELVERGKKEFLIKHTDNTILLAYIAGFIKELAAHSRFYSVKLGKEEIEAAFQLCWDGIKA